MILVEEKRVLFLVFKNTNISNNSELYNYALAEKENEKEKETKKNAKKSFVNSEINELNTVIDDSTFIIMGKYNETFKVDRQSDIETKKGEKLLFHIRKNKDFNYLIENPIPLKISEENTDILNLKLYLVINSENKEKNINEDYYICNNDIIKFGNLKYTVEIIKNKKEHINNKSSIENENETKEKSENLTDVNEEAPRQNTIDNESEMNEEEPSKTTIMNYDISSLNRTTGCILDFKLKSPLFYDALNDDLKIKCYLCGEKECNKDNPIIKICNCNFAHFECLKELVKRKVIIKENKNKNVRNYYIKRIICKNCKCIYPYKFKINEKILNLFNIETSKESDYLILRSIENKIYLNNMMLIHVIELNNEIIKIGKSFIDGDNDVIIIDPSVSKEHAIIKYNKDNGSLLLKNNNSKYGTLVLIKKSLKINEKKIQIQVGKTVVEAQVMKYGDFEKNFKNRNSKYPLPKKY